MRLWQRLRRVWLPSSVRARLDLETGERVLAHAATADGGYVVATDRALYVTGMLHLGWEQIEHAEWSGHTLLVRETASLGQKQPQHRIRVPEPGMLPEAVQDRVSASIVVNQYARLEGRSGVRIVGRRRPGGEQVTWTLLFDAEPDARNPVLRDQAMQLLADVQRQTGL